DQEQRLVGIRGGARELQEPVALRPGIGREQLLALIEAQHWQRIRRLRQERAPRSGLSQLPQQVDAALRRRQAPPYGGAARPPARAARGSFDRGRQALASLDRAATTRSNCPQRQPLAVVAQKPGPQPGAQERGLAGAGGAENDQQPRRLACRKPAQRV